MTPDPTPCPTCAEPTRPDLEKLKALEAKATNAPWECRLFDSAQQVVLGPYMGRLALIATHTGDNKDNDAALHIAARNSLPDLIRWIEHIETQLAELRAKLDQVDDVLVVNWVGPRKDGDYRQALADLVTFNIQIHDDPAVSEVAANKKRELDELRTQLADAQRQRDELTKALSEATSSLDDLSDGACHSKYGPGCDMGCKNAAYRAWTKAYAALDAALTSSTPEGKK